MFFKNFFFFLGVLSVGVANFKELNAACFARKPSLEKMNKGDAWKGKKSVFLGIDLRDWKELQHLQQTARSQIATNEIFTPGQLHCTLLFLGSKTFKETQKIISEASTIIQEFMRRKSHPHFYLAFDPNRLVQQGFITKTDIKKPLRASPDLKELQEALTCFADTKLSRAWNPHATLFRNINPTNASLFYDAVRNAAQNMRLQNRTYTVKEISLFVTTHNVTYKPIYTWKL